MPGIVFTPMPNFVPLPMATPSDFIPVAVFSPLTVAEFQRGPRAYWP